MFLPGTYEQSLAEMREAVRLDPDDPSSHYGLGYELRYRGKLAEAERELHVALRLNPGYAKAYGLLGDFCALHKDYTAAATNYRAAIRVGGYSGQMYESLCLRSLASRPLRLGACDGSRRAAFLQ